MDVITAIKEAIKNETTIDIIYHGGSTPGKIRSVFPLYIEDDKLIARPANHFFAKTYFLFKIEIWDGNAIPELSEDEKILNLTSIEDYRLLFEESIKKPGILIAFSDLSIEVRAVSKKTNKPLKHPFLSLTYDPDNDPTRPWLVAGFRYKYIGKALLKFHTLAKQ